MLLILILLFAYINYISCLTINSNSKLVTYNNGLGFLSFDDQFSELTNINVIIDNTTYIPNFNYTFNDNLYYYSYNTTFICTNFDTYPIYLSINNTIIDTNNFVINKEYINLYNNSININNNLNSPTQTDLIITSTSVWLITTGIITTIITLIIILICIKYNKSKTYSFLYSIDQLHSRIFNDVPTSDEHEQEEVLKLGIGYIVIERTSVLGGILTIIVVIISIFTITSYFYDSLSNNIIQTSTLSINNNNYNIPIDKSYIYTEITFHNILYGNCIDIENKCDSNWNINSNNFYMSDPICIQNNNDCKIIYSCSSCTVDIGTDLLLNFNYNSVNVAYQWIDYMIKTNSYDGDSIISGNITTSNIFTGYIGNLISVSIIPTIYQKVSGVLVGYVLDYQNTFVGSTMNFTNYKNLYNSNNIISNSIKISKNPNWLSIIIPPQSSGLIVFSQIFAIISGIYTISSLIYNIVNSKTFRIIIHDLFFKKKKEKIINIYNSIEYNNTMIDQIKK